MHRHSQPRLRLPGALSTRAAVGLLLGAASVILVTPTAAMAQGARTVPAPEDVVGFELGNDYMLADYGQVLEYVEALAEASPRVRLDTIGTSTLGRPMVLAYVSSEANLARLPRIREINRRLALAKGVDEAEARTLAREGVATVWIDGGLHATEVAHSQHTPELGWWLATSESEEARRTRENVLLLLMPNINPDGLDIVTSWYRSNLGTPYETAPIPGLYHHYVGHDNNRDWYAFTQAESRVAAEVFYHDWFPQIIYNHHQTGPFPGRIWVPPPVDPLNLYVDPLMPAAFSEIGQSMLKRFMREGKPGVTTGIGYRVAWGGGFMHAAPQLHNMLGMFTETALYRYATPHCYDDEEIGETFSRGIPMSTRQPSMHYIVPWEGGCWHMRDAMDYMMTASRAVLDAAGKLKEDYLHDIWRMGSRQTAKGERGEGGPFAYVFDPAEQHDPSGLVALMRVMRRAGIEVHRADRTFRAGGRDFPAGAWVIGPQAFRPFVLDVLERRVYPDRFDYPGGPPERPYDFTGYNLADQFGVALHRIAEPFEIPGPTVDRVRPDPGEVTGEAGWGWLLSPTSNDAYRAVNRLLASGADVGRAVDGFRAAGVGWPAGTFVVRAADRSDVEPPAEALGLDFVGVTDPPPVEVRTIGAPRVALYKSWVTTMPEGWTRWVLDSFEFRADTLHDADIRQGRLADYDVLVLPDQGADGIRTGHPAGTMPEEYTGGLGAEGAAAVTRFVEGGGWLLAVHQSVDWAVESLGLPVRNAAEDVDPRRFYIPGTLVAVDVDTDDPVTWGMDEEAAALFWRHAQAMRVLPAASEPSARDGAQSVERAVTVFTRFPEDDLLVDGWEIGGERMLGGEPAGLRMPRGEGQVVLLGFRPDTRGQPRNTFKLLFNPLYAATMEGVGGR